MSSDINFQSRCPHLGSARDPDTWFGFPTKENLCHRAHPAQRIALSYQSDICLSQNHIACQVFQHPEKWRGPLPDNIRQESAPKAAHVQHWDAEWMKRVTGKPSQDIIPTDQVIKDTDQETPRGVEESYQDSTTLIDDDFPKDIEEASRVSERPLTDIDETEYPPQSIAIQEQVFEAPAEEADRADHMLEGAYESGDEVVHVDEKPSLDLEEIEQAESPAETPPQDVDEIGQDMVDSPGDLDSSTLPSAEHLLDTGESEPTAEISTEDVDQPELLTEDKLEDFDEQLERGDDLLGGVDAGEELEEELPPDTGDWEKSVDDQYDELEEWVESDKDLPVYSDALGQPDNGLSPEAGEASASIESHEESSDWPEHLADRVSPASDVPPTRQKPKVPRVGVMVLLIGGLVLIGLVLVASFGLQLLSPRPELTAEPSATPLSALVDTISPTLPPTATFPPTFTPAPTVEPVTISPSSPVDTTPTESPEQTPPTEETALNVFLIYDSNLRAGPSTDFEIVESLSAGTRLVIMGRDQVGLWFWVRTQEGLEGWVAVSQVHISGSIDIFLIPVAPNVPALP